MVETVTSATRDRLRDAPAVAALVESRVFRDDRPEGTGLPALLIFLISDPRPTTFAGPIGQRRSRVQIDCLGRSSGEADDVAETAIREMQRADVIIGGIRFGPSFVVNVRSSVSRPAEGVDDQIFIRSTDLQIWWSPF